ncbi:hypothetical protein C8R43DRAFT_1019692 [Mycena crocata]|nr:hypothetical protein C8R43DRAFT_1019692 [Mycena crocata]
MARERAKKGVGEKVLFQRKMKLMGRDSLYNRFRELIRFMVFAFFDVEHPVSKQKPGAWSIFQVELKRLFPRFEDKEGGIERMKSAVCFAKECIKDYRRKAMSLRVPRIRIESCEDLEKAIKAVEMRAKGSAVKTESSPQPTVIPPEEVNVQRNDFHVDTPGKSYVLNFLEGCHPSLTFLLRDFIAAGIDQREWITAMHAWPRPSLQDFLQRNFNRKEDGRPDEEGLVIRTLLTRFDNVNLYAKTL